MTDPRLAALRRLLAASADATATRPGVSSVAGLLAAGKYLTPEDEPAPAPVRPFSPNAIGARQPETVLDAYYRRRASTPTTPEAGVRGLLRGASLRAAPLASSAIRAAVGPTTLNDELTLEGERRRQEGMVGTVAEALGTAATFGAGARALGAIAPGAPLGQRIAANYTAGGLGPAIDVADAVATPGTMQDKLKRLAANTALSLGAAGAVESVAPLLKDAGKAMQPSGKPLDDTSGKLYFPLPEKDADEIAKKFKGTSDADLAARYQEVWRRRQTTAEVDPGLTEWTRFDETAQAQRYGRTFAAGRQQGAIQRDERVLAEVEAELERRGFTNDQLHALTDLATTGKVRDDLATFPLDRPLVAREPWSAVPDEEIPLPDAPPAGPPPIRGNRSTAGAQPEDEFVNVPKFNLSGDTEGRLRAEVRRVVEEKGLDPKPVVSWEETRATAAALGLDPKALAEADVQRMTGPELLAIRNLVNANVRELERLAKLPVAATADAELAKATAMGALEEQNTALLETFVKARSNTGRWLNNLKILAANTTDPVFWLTKARNVVGRPLEQAEERAVTAALAEGPEAVAETIAKLGSGAPEKLFAFYQANLLTSPATHVVNTTSNALMAMTEQAKNAPAAFADRLLSLRTGQRTMAGVSVQELRAGAQGARDGLTRVPDILRRGGATSPTELAKQVRFDNPILDRYVQSVFNALNAGDAVFHTAALQGALVNRARARAMTEGAADVAARAAELVRVPDDALFLGAMVDANEATFKDRTLIGTFLRSLQRGPGKYVVPFSRTPGAIAHRQIEYSPLGLGMGAVEAVRTLVQGKGVDPELQRHAAKLLGRGATGTTLMGLGYLAYKAGLLTPPTAAEAKTERDTENLTGDAANSLRVGGKNVGIQRLTPVANMLLLGAVLGEALANDDAEGLTGLGGTVVGSTLASVMDQPFLQGVDRVLAGVRDPIGAGGDALKGVPAGFVPAAALLGSVARTADPTIRETRTGRGVGADAAAQVRARLPGASHGLPAQRDQFGREKRREGGALNLVSPFPVRTRDTDPVVQEIARLGVEVSARRADKRMGPEATRALVASEGPKLHRALGAVVAMPEYRGWSDDQKRAALEQVRDRVRSNERRLATLRARLAEAR